MRGEPIRQDYLATVLKWKSGGDVKNYMAVRQHAVAATDEWLYFKAVVGWVETLFTKYRGARTGSAEWTQHASGHSRKWRPTTSRHGPRAAGRFLKTARCSAPTAIGARATYNVHAAADVPREMV